MNNQKYKKVDKYLLIINCPLGSGAFGKVYKARLVNNTQLVFAIKVIEKKTIQKDQYLLKALFNQVSIMKKLKSSFIVSLEQVLETTNNYYIIQQYCDSGDLRKFIEKNKQGVEEDYAIRIIGDILQGFIQLLKFGIIHRDLKPQNILIHQGIFKIADFGFAKNLVNFKNQILKSFVGTPLYMSPQMLKEEDHTSKSDIWSLGLILYQLLHGRTPWRATKQYQLVKKIETQNVEFKKSISPKLIELITGCLKRTQNQRISFDEIYTQNIFKSRFQKYIQKTKGLQNKAMFIINQLRFQIHSNNINMLNLFQEYDYSKDAKLNKRQFYKLLLSIDKKIKKQEVYYIFNKFDNDGNGQIQFTEFKQWLQENNIRMKGKVFDLEKMSQTEKKVHQAIIKLKLAIDQSKMELKKIFSNFDKDNSDQLDFDQFGKLIRLIVPDITKDQCASAFEMFDVNGDKLITYQQFRDLLIKISGKAPVFDSEFQQRLKLIDIQLKQEQNKK